MKINDTIKIFHDGKIFRDEPAVILAVRAGGIQVSFVPVSELERITVWCRRRSLTGLYEAIGWNYWILPEYSEYSGSVHELVQKRDMEIVKNWG